MAREQQISEELKKAYAEAAERRKAAGIRLGRWAVMMDTKALVTVHEFWGSWVKAFGKTKAVDFLLEAMANEHNLLRERLKQGLIKRKTE